MKNITVTECEKHLSTADIAELEQELQMILPEDYKEFLFKHNGGHPVKNCYPVMSQELEMANISWFYAFYDGEYENLMTNYARSMDIVPEGFLPIACTGGNDQVCLGLSSEVFGKVYLFVQYWGMDENNEPLSDCMYTIANSFVDFINSLYFYDVDGSLNEDGIFVATEIKNIHDIYSLPYSTEAKKYGAIVTEFFAKAPSEVEDYLIVKNDSDEVRTLQYSVTSQGVRFCRRINADGSFEDYQEQLAG